MNLPVRTRWGGTFRRNEPLVKDLDLTDHTAVGGERDLRLLSGIVWAVNQAAEEHYLHLCVCVQTTA